MIRNSPDDVLARARTTPPNQLPSLVREIGEAIAKLEEARLIAIQRVTAELAVSMQPAEMVSARQLSQRVGLAEETLLRLSRTGRIPTTIVGRRRLFDPNAVVAVLKDGNVVPRRKKGEPPRVSRRKRQSANVRSRSHFIKT